MNLIDIRKLIGLNQPTKGSHSIQTLSTNQPMIDEIYHTNINLNMSDGGIQLFVLVQVYLIRVSVGV